MHFGINGIFEYPLPVQDIRVDLMALSLLQRSLMNFERTMLRKNCHSPEKEGHL